MKHSAEVLAAALLVAVTGAPVCAQVENLEWGGDLSVMGVYVNNTRDLHSRGGAADVNLYPRSVLQDRFPRTLVDDDEESFIRTEGHVWMRALLSENVRVKMTLAFDRVFSSNDAFVDVDDDSSIGRPADDDLDVYLEEAYIQASSLLDLPWTVTVGRMLVQWGSGFVIGDALPESPTNFADLGGHRQDPFDAVNIDWELSRDLVLTFLYSKVSETRDLDEDTDLVGTNLRYSVPEQAILEAYYLYYAMDGDGQAGVPEGPHFDVHQVGVRGDLFLGEFVELNAEVTYQFEGEIENPATPAGNKLDIEALAAEAGARFNLTDNFAVGLSAAWLDGSEGPDDEEYHRYIQLADNRVYGEIADFYSGLISNDMLDEYFAGVYVLNLDAEATFDALMLALEAYYFYAENTVTDRQGNESGDKSIGWEMDVYSKYRLTENLDAELAAGFFDPDDAAIEWAGGQDSVAWFARAGLRVTW